MKWPQNKKFAFTIIDDTDNATLFNIKPVYDLLIKLNIYTTKTVWVYPSRDRFTGETIQDESYRDYLLNLKELGFEIALHGVGSGNFIRQEIIDGLKLYKECFSSFPTMHINHAQNKHNLYWGKRNGSLLFQKYKNIRIPNEVFYGDVVDSDCYWGDFSKENVKYIRSRIFDNINTLKCDPRMPYRDKDKEAGSNFWFSSSDGANVKLFNKLVCPANIDKLEKEQGLCIVYTHFASQFVNTEGKLDEEFVRNMEYLASKGGWFVPASQMLDYLLSLKQKEIESELYFTALDLKLLLQRIKQKCSR